MKNLYILFFLKIPLMFFSICCLYSNSYSQCPNGQPSGGTAYDTTISFGSGIVSTEIKFPKFDPQNGLVTCVKLCVTIKGIIDTVALENFSNAPQTGSYTYNRKDTITGSGIPTYLTSSANLNFGPFPLASTNGIMGSGPDFYSNGPDTVLTRVLCSNISDSVTISQFYGVSDSVTYNYSIDADAVGMVTGGSSLAFVLSSALVNFHFEYCTCPSSALPLNVHEFVVEKAGANKAQLSWNGFDNLAKDYHYEIELSQNGSDFSTIQTIPKNFAGNNYKYVYTTGKSENRKYFFRIKQVYSNGYPRFSEVKSIELENSNNPKINIYPNPSNGVVGIKFVNTYSGKFLIQISNTQGQTVYSKEEENYGDGYKYITTLQRGMYWLKLIDVTSHLSCVNQLLIK